MFLQNTMGKIASQLLPAKTALAHCDIPCGIYDPHGAQIAALTVVRMHQLIEAQEKPSSDASSQERDTYTATLSRYVSTKEQHAEVCKQELRVLWGDYFRPEHVEQHKNLHDLFWNAMKQASKTRQTIDMAAAQDLLSTTQQIAEVFWQTKGAESVRQPSRQAVGGELVYPTG
jgi:nickel superoxide dismutase